MVSKLLGNKSKINLNTTFSQPLYCHFKLPKFNNRSCNKAKISSRNRAVAGAYSLRIADSCNDRGIKPIAFSVASLCYPATAKASDSLGLRAL
jgi:hypothetical protein